MRQICSDVAALVLRIAAGLIFIPHGWAKVFGEGGPGAFAAGLPDLGIPAFLGYIAAYAELFGGALLILGLLTRLDAFLLACTIGVAAFVVKLPDALYEVQPGQIKLFVVVRGLEIELALLAIAIALLLTGAGRISLDGLLRVDERVASLFRRKK
ncbi:MAG TPA: DoxX family protein [Thermoanaerobaculia bacterium]|nr:DoxX family protein [Thermoanaerobaculia bacterium]